MNPRILNRKTGFLPNRKHWQVLARLRLLICALLLLLSLSSPPNAAAMHFAPAVDTIVRCEQLVYNSPITSNLNVDLYIENVTDLYGAEMRLTFNPAAMQVVDADPGTSGVQILPLSGFLSQDFVVKKVADNNAGTIWYAATQLNPSPPVSGTGAVVRVIFQPVITGTFTLTFTYQKLATINGEQIPATTQNCTLIFESNPATPTQPPATQTPVPPTATPTQPPATQTPEPTATPTQPPATQTPQPNSTFSDVPLDHSLYAYIENLYHNGITSGCSTNPLRFCPESNVTRAQMAVFLLRSKYGNNYTPPPATGIFADVPMTYWAVKWIEQLYNEGITSGCAISPLEYCPENNATRAEMAIFLMRSKYGTGYVSAPATSIFTDVPTTYWAAGWINQLAAEGITTGCGSGDYCPENPVTRAQMAAFLVRAFNLP